ncbi:hypothetical protein PtrM4_046830 [Pyrenophora tritici-repentis]|uniref:Uncharacterized protein n=2 Tax=Pyrenophora tritici-repentis TaxID=45151 RepID=A0A834RJZ9_9PLEO|nr:uncharacterized protein PTRG_06227 [Pyrenophora tritici-repentis Pt-1C-BFP]EDU49147.1 predicted protein [Pyrenophora tritici-repentis Pt-1C-BFP]KAF7565249.1 hypothetical protein PtrM4_046830 [Pyrenophora tritici-repentis]
MAPDSDTIVVQLPEDLRTPSILDDEMETDERHQDNPTTPIEQTTCERSGSARYTKKEQDDLKLAIKLRNDRVITTLGAPFKASNDQEISDLVGRGVFKFEQYDERLHSKI